MTIVLIFLDLQTNAAVILTRVRPLQGAAKGGDPARGFARRRTVFAATIRAPAAESYAGSPCVDAAERRARTRMTTFYFSRSTNQRGRHPHPSAPASGRSEGWGPAEDSAAGVTYLLQRERRLRRSLALGPRASTRRKGRARTRMTTLLFFSIYKPTRPSSSPECARFRAQRRVGTQREDSAAGVLIHCNEKDALRASLALGVPVRRRGGRAALARG